MLFRFIDKIHLHEIKKLVSKKKKKNPNEKVCAEIEKVDAWDVDSTRLNRRLAPAGYCTDNEIVSLRGGHTCS